jgi:hypothetical protein
VEDRHSIYRLLEPGASNQWYTYNWPPEQQVVWTGSSHPEIGCPQVEWSVAVNRESETACTYWITVHNLTQEAVDFEGRFAILV